MPNAGAPAPSPHAVRQLAGTLSAVADRVDRQHEALPTPASKPASAPAADETLQPVTETVSSVLSVIASDRPPTLAAR
jgi:hypothetical protein